MTSKKISAGQNIKVRYGEWSFSKIEKKNIVNIPTVIKMQCLRKKK